MKEYKLKTLKSSVEGRREEIATYEINIANYKDIIRQIEEKYKDTQSADVDDAIKASDIEFSRHLETQIFENQAQLSRAHFILNSILNQIELLQKEY